MKSNLILIAVEDFNPDLPNIRHSNSKHSSSMSKDYISENQSNTHNHSSQTSRGSRSRVPHLNIVLKPIHETGLMMTNIKDRNEQRTQDGLRYKFPSKVKPSGRHLCDFYEANSTRKKFFYGARESTVSKIAKQTSALSVSESLADDPIADALFDRQSAIRSRRSIDVPMEGDLILRDSKLNIERRKSISKGRRKDGETSGAETPLLRLGRAWQSEEGILQGDLEQDRADSKRDGEEEYSSRLDRLLAKKKDPKLVKENSKVFKEGGGVGHQSYWMKCINKCLEQKDLQKHNKIGYLETVSTTLAKFSGLDIKSSL